jgi:hypothetical protein
MHCGVQQSSNQSAAMYWKIGLIAKENMLHSSSGA